MERNDILAKLGIAQLSEMQQATADVFAQTNKNIVVLSPTGTGKTLAYLLPLVAEIDTNSDQVQAVVIVPGRELAMQSANVLASMKCGVRGMACYGGRMTMEEHRKMNEILPQIVFATPGRLNDHLDKENIAATTIRTVVIDEFDKCLDMGFADEMYSIMRKLKFARRHVLLSATNSNEIPRFVDLKNAEFINYLEDARDVSNRVSINVLRSPVKDKLEVLLKYICMVGDTSSIVFVNHRESVERIGQFLAENGVTASIFHGGFDQKGREDALYKFSNGSANVLVCTDLGSRGLDIDNISNVVHYHLPETQDAYIHRTGRTARWNSSGNTVFILGPDESLPQYVKGAEDMTLPESVPAPARPKMATIYIGKGKKDKISRGDILGFLCKKGDLANGDIGKIDVKERYAYVAVKRESVNALLAKIKNEKIKGLRTVFEKIK